MARSIANSILRDTSKHNKSGGRAPASMKATKVKGKGNQRSFGIVKQSKAVGSINSGGNYGPVGY